MTPSRSIALVASTAQVLATLPGEPLAADASDRRDRLRREADRADFTAARLLAGVAHRVLTGEPLPAAALVQRCDACGGPHGRPQPTAAGVHLSWAHAGGWVAAAAGTGRLGVDVEPLAAARAGVPVPALTADEQRIADDSPDPAATALRAWTAKEALVKAGVARLDDLARLQVLTAGGPVSSRVAGFTLAVHTLRDAVAAVASAGGIGWFALGADGEPVAAPPRLVGGAA